MLRAAKDSGLFLCIRESPLPRAFHDVVTIETKLTGLRRVSLSFNYRIIRHADDCLLATGSTKHACIDRHGQVTRIPPILETALSAAQG